jgi:signal peptidase II
VDSIGFDCAIFNFADNLLIAGAISLILFALRPEPVQPADAANPEPVLSHAEWR